MRVQVTNAPKGATITSLNWGDFNEKDSDLGQAYVSDSFYANPGRRLHGIQDAGEQGISNVKLRLIRDPDYNAFFLSPCESDGVEPTFYWKG
jgi:hypothetical protein